ncbi:Hypothetical predicted protein [Olea europaea subsp. europaea]|uniref:Exostosin GT47 domain-containing protein n=1 Tax=Olea europaea subsp. europaea TaxID=158383 RepID=A0A8S0RF57_OLEEU|nr:Hypothetical predicted protein [Olea europaea subsp. europaea]
MQNSAYLHVENPRGLFAFTSHSLWFVSYYLHISYANQLFLNSLLPFGCAEQECVPVILSDQVELPFQNIVDYRQISIKWPSTRIGPELLDYLESIPDNDIEDMIAQGRKVRCLWVYAPESESCSAFTGIMWELQKKVTQFHQSTETFWLHNGSIVNRDLVEFSKWKPPLPLP